MHRYNSIIVLGPTASGKTRFAVALAMALNGEVISMDSRQVYRRLDIGTGKDYGDYTVGGTTVPYHLIDMVEPNERFNVFDFLRAFNRGWDNILEREKLPVLCGGTGLYYDVLLKKNELVAVPVNETLRSELLKLSKTELEEKLRAYPDHRKFTFDFSTAKRLIRAIEIMEYLKGNEAPVTVFKDIRPLIIGIKTDVETRRKNISQRLQQRLKNGLIGEAENLLLSGVTHEQLQYFGLEYKFLSLYLRGELSKEEMFTRLETAIHQYARRQMTWFRKMEREGFDIHWMENNEIEKAITLFNQ